MKTCNLGVQARLVLLSPQNVWKLGSLYQRPRSHLRENHPLHAFYSAILLRTEMGIFEPVSQSEFGDLLSVLEGVRIVSLSLSLTTASGLSSSSGKGRKAFGRSASFGAGLGKNGAGAVVEGMWGDEVLHGLGATGVPADEGAGVDPREEELCGI